MQIEPANVHDLDAVVLLLTAQFAEHQIRLPPAALTEAVRVLLVDGGRGVILLAREPEPVGVAVLAYTWTLEHAGLVAWLDELFVVPERRGHGVGRALLRKALDIAKLRGCRAVELEVEKEHTRASHLYEREGFRMLPRQRWSIPVLPVTAP